MKREQTGKCTCADTRAARRSRDGFGAGPLLTSPVEAGTSTLCFALRYTVFILTSTPGAGPEGRHAEQGQPWGQGRARGCPPVLSEEELQPGPETASSAVSKTETKAQSQGKLARLTGQQPKASELTFPGRTPARFHAGPWGQALPTAFESFGVSLQLSLNVQRVLPCVHWWVGVLIQGG